jgi:ABC-type glycerol-3-phosphate transport system permease component
MTRKHRLLHLVLKMDQAGSSGYIAVALVAAPIIALISPLRQLMWLVGLVLGVSGLALGLLGFLMAWGLTVTMSRGEDLPDRIWESVRMLPKP